MDIFGDSFDFAGENASDVFSGFFDTSVAELGVDGLDGWTEWAGDGGLFEIDFGVDSDVFDPYDWGMEDEIFGGDYGSDLSQDLGASYMSEDELYNLVGGSGAFGEGFVPRILGEAMKTVAGSGDGSSGDGSSGSGGKALAKAGASTAKNVLTNTAKNVLTKAGTSAANNLLNSATSAKSSGTQGGGLQYGGDPLGSSFKLPLSTKLASVGSAAPTAKGFVKPGPVSKLGVEAAKQSNRSDQVMKYLQQVASNEMYRTSGYDFSPSLTKRYSVAS